MLWVLDLDGVVWLAGQPIPGAPEAVARLRATGASVAFVTNNSTPTLAEHVQRLARAGIEAVEAELVTSAQAAASLLEPGQRVAVVGGRGVTEAVLDRNAEPVGPESSPEAVIVGRSLQLDFGGLAAAARAISDGARFIATNTDATFPTPSGTEPGTGALVAYLEVAAGRKAEVAGKPGAAMAGLLSRRFGSPDVVVGDRAETDGAFAERLGAPFALVLSGVTRRSDLPVWPEPAVVADDLAAGVEAVLNGPSAPARVQVSCAMARDDPFKRASDAGADLFLTARARAEDLLRELTRAGSDSQERAQGIFEELVEGGRKGTEALVATIRREIGSQVRMLGLATKEDLAELERRLTERMSSEAQRRGPSSSAAGGSGDTARRSAARKTADSTRTTADKTGAAKKPGRKTAAKKTTR